MNLFLLLALPSLAHAFAPPAVQRPLASPRLRPQAAIAKVPLASPRPQAAIAKLPRAKTPVAVYGGGGFNSGPPGLPPRGGFDPRELVGPIIFISLIASGALGWLFNGLLFLSLIPLVAGPLFSWYLQNNLLEGNCPECGAPVQVLKGQPGMCMSCGSTMSSELSANGVFFREGAAAREDGVVEVDVLTDDDPFGGPPRSW